MNKKIFKIKFESRDFTLGETAYVDSQEAFEAVFQEDAMRINQLCFTNQDHGKLYMHEYPWQPHGGVTIIKLGYVRQSEPYDCSWDFASTKRIDYAHCVVVISLKVYNPYIAIVNYSPAFNNADDVVKILSFTLDKALKRYGLSIAINPCNEQKATDWYNYMCKKYLDAKSYQHKMIESLENFGKPLEYDGIKSIACDKEKTSKIVNLLNQLMNEYEEPIESIMPLTAAIKAGVFKRKPYYSEFSLWFPSIKCSETSYYRLTDTQCKSYFRNDAFNEMVKRFMSL